LAASKGSGVITWLNEGDVTLKIAEPIGVTINEHGRSGQGLNTDLSLSVSSD
jgi:hypothetical protein